MGAEWGLYGHKVRMRGFAYARVRARAKCLHVSFLFIDAFRTALALIFLHFIYTATIIIYIVPYFLPMLHS